MSIEQVLRERLATLSPSHLEVVNESSGHGGYYPGKESHFKAVIVSEAFAGLRQVQRHQKVYAAVGDLLSGKNPCISNPCFCSRRVERSGYDQS